MRAKKDLYPNFSAEIEYIRNNGVDEYILHKIINKHRYNSKYNQMLYDRYCTVEEGVPIFHRKPRFDENDATINNKINNDFFSEIIDFKVGYFAGKPIAYGYSSTEESEEMTGGTEALDEATKALTDFTTRNNMYDVDMEITKFASICGYAGRLFYIDKDTNERCMAISPFETIILSNTDITEPEFGIRYYWRKDIDDNKVWYVEFYDDINIYYYQGQLSNLSFVESKPHLFDYCPLQGIPNNKELLGDGEKVLSLIDAYDSAFSDNANDIESFANAYMVFENVQIKDDEIRKAQKSGSIKFYTGGSQGKVYFLTKDINDTFVQNYLEKIEDNIYRFSKTPNLGDESFGSASGISLKFKLTGLETKCGMFQAKMLSAGTYMFKVIGSSFIKKRIEFDPLQCTMDFTRNFPLDLLSEAQTLQAFIAGGLPKRVAFSQLSFVDDVDYIMELLDEEQEGIPALDIDIPSDTDDDSASNNEGEVNGAE